jgi:hypothetical protein
MLAAEVTLWEQAYPKANTAAAETGEGGMTKESMTAELNEANDPFQPRNTPAPDNVAITCTVAPAQKLPAVHPALLVGEVRTVPGPLTLRVRG